MDDAVWVPTVFTRNWARRIEHDVVVGLFNQIVRQTDERELLSNEHFSVDGTLIQVWSGHKNFVNKTCLEADGHTQREAAKIMSTMCVKAILATTRGRIRSRM